MMDEDSRLNDEKRRLRHVRLHGYDLFVVPLNAKDCIRYFVSPPAFLEVP